MKSQTMAYLLMGLGLATLMACTNLQGAAPSPSSDASPRPSGGTAQVQAGDRPRPDTRVLPINIEGQLTEIELRLFDQAPLPFTTYVPIKDFTSEVGSSEEGTGVRFYYSPKGVKDEKAYIHIFLPTQNMPVDGVRDLILGDGGLLASNGWELVDRTDIVSYS
ncbi:MAG TPA: hypothetical protein V6C57_03575 [Coleofasciculaceae cyanobacterium]